MQERKTFGSYEAAQLAEVEREDIRNWMQKRYLPEGEIVPWGSKFRTVYTDREVYSIRLFQVLKLQGLTNKAASEIVNHIHWEEKSELIAIHWNDTEFRFVVLNGLSVVEIEKLKELDSVLMINLKTISQEIDNRIAGM